MNYTQNSPVPNHRLTPHPHQTPAPRYSTPASQPHQVYQSRPPSVAGGFVAGNDEIIKMFAAVDIDHSGSITIRELQRALVNGNWTNFDLDTCQMLMNMFDVNRDGTIGLNEFIGLWKYISDWQNVFRQFDHDGSGSIDGAELASALRSFGYNLSPTILMLLEQKYASLPSDTGVRQYSTGITFDRFVRACVTVRTLTENFRREDTDRDGIIQITYETFMKLMLSTP